MDQSKLSIIWARLRDDLAFRVGTLYAGASWFVVEAADTLGARPALVRTIALVLLAGFPVLIGAVLLVQRRLVVRLGAGRRRWAGALLALLVVATGLWGFGSRLSGSPVVAAASYVAVLPFNASGSEEVREFGVGMVDVLSAALGDVGGIRTVPARTVLARIGRDERGGALTLEESLAVGRGLGAGSVLTGGVTVFGTRARLTAELHEVRAGSLLARAELDGSRDSIIELTDRLAMELLRELWRSRAPLPTVRIAAITTSSPVALRYYLRGEEHLRALRFDSATWALQRAIEVDSTFALAWLRLADAEGWTDAAGENLDARREFARRAASLAERLPERERALARAQALALAGDFTAFDSLAIFVERYPDDPMGWYYLGDVRFHSGYLGTFSDEDIIRPFLESTRLDPALGIGLHHVIDLALERGDRALFDSAAAQYAAFAAPARVANVRDRGDLRWAPADSVVPRFARMLRQAEPADGRWAVAALLGTVGRKVRLDADVDPRIYVHAMDSIAAILGSDRYWRERAQTLRALAYAALGRAAEFDAALAARFDPARDAVPGLTVRQSRALIRVAWATANSGLPHQALAEDVRLLEEVPDHAEAARVLVQYHIANGDTATARRHHRPPDFSLMPPAWLSVDTAALRRGMDAFDRIQFGDAAGGLAAMDQALRDIGFADLQRFGGPWFEVGAARAAVPEHRTAGIRMLRWITRTWSSHTGDAYLLLARALEAEGDRAGAREAYQHVIRFWHDADPHRHKQREEARQALVRLAGEG